MRQGLLAGYLVAAAASLSYAIAQVTARMVVRQIAPPLVMSAFSLLFGAFFLFLFVLPRLPRELRASNRRRGMVFFVATGVVGGLAVTAMYTALGYSPVAAVSSLAATHPIFALLFTHLFLQHLERVTRRVLVGTALVVLGVVMITLSQV